MRMVEREDMAFSGLKHLLVELVVLSCLNLCNGAEPCKPDLCKLPDCFCSGASVPNGIDPKQIPQMIMLTFDDAINMQVFPFYQTLFNDTKNPNGCNVRATFFVSHEYTDYQLLGTLYHERHEIADHTISHRTPIEWWKKATYQDWGSEIRGMRDILKEFGGVNEKDVRGFRAPFLQIGGDNQFKVLHDHSFMFDSSMPTWRTDPPLWPYTLDYSSAQDCVIPPCPSGSFPGLWEVPMVYHKGLQNESCSMIDDCNAPTNDDDVFKFLHKNFLRHYNSNRAPFPIFMHANWFAKYSFTMKGMQRFFTEVLAKGDVYLVTVSQAIEWIKTPSPLDEIKSFSPWQCGQPAPTSPCKRSAVNVCHFPDKARYLWSCVRPCPEHYPWTENMYDAHYESPTSSSTSSSPSSSPSSSSSLPSSSQSNAHRCDICLLMTLMGALSVLLVR